MTKKDGVILFNLSSYLVVKEKFIDSVNFLIYAGEDDGRNQAELETKVWEPESQLTDKQIDQFLVIAR